MKIACLSFSERGKSLGEKIKKYSNQQGKYILDHFNNREVRSGIKSLMPRLIMEYDGLIFISATGIAIRFINPYIVDKTLDPAVVVVDDMGRFSISLLSGHIGGGNELANWIGNTIGAIPVITTATDNRGIEAVDIFAMKNNYYIENMVDAKNITAMMVDGKKIGFYSEMDEIIQYDNLIVVEDLDYIDSSIFGLIIISSDYDEKLENIKSNYGVCQLIPRNINIGIGCRKGVEGNKIIDAVKRELEETNLSVKGIKSIGTIEVKKDEIGIIEAAKYFDSPLKIFTIDEIKEVEDKFEGSQFVKDTIGVYSVSEPAAHLMGGNLISRKSKYNGITISIAKEIKNE
ncbi:MAG: cobalt-precorrin 5A hydrolase [Tissierellia bacterium]|nr:cobalt-precorrin 5A hydrolase [Tissierellia bacterium]